MTLGVQLIPINSGEAKQDQHDCPNALQVLFVLISAPLYAGVLSRLKENF